MSATDDILVGVDGGVAIITLNRPERRNAWTLDMANGLNRALRTLDDDDTVRVIVITGAGHAFCVGADLGSADAFSSDDSFVDPTSADTLVAPWSLRKPVVAALNGHTVGVGMSYALQCDLRFVAREAKLAFAFVRRGVMPELAAHALLPRLVGVSVAADLILSGRTISGSEAVTIGLANSAHDSVDVLPAALAWANDVAANTAPVSVAVAKRLLWEGLTATPIEMLRRESRIMPWICNQPDATEGVAAFLERRAPAWTMRPSEDLLGWPDVPSS